eukprot:scaffold221359_cov44-Prasinocladus_malaysianus.AAC.1
MAMVSTFPEIPSSPSKMWTILLIVNMTVVTKATGAAGTATGTISRRANKKLYKSKHWRGEQKGGHFVKLNCSMDAHQGLRTVLTRAMKGGEFGDHKTTKHWDGAAKTKHQLMLKATESLRRHRLAAFSIRKTKTAVESIMKSMQSAGSTETMDVQRGTILTKWRLALLKGVIDKRLLM